ncbi:uncharacterized protein MICPUCDRAFT_62079 [Micromonas pusilla CCMP1545]|uniref:Predicted protein n=1 Tax=Micromonas pusilla (strain CCMP1545) TaxID=564608 RepID=C1MNX2_MICPC|nr:uncharacterized protein MICPUCDRAFT_62079 [Micromonas pusilla CCMP1545]EEH58831.1 predicted protein [Micromonas pusilla CCMP1545]|eukprot:XP_003057186.1 predicted protein [Micromonas pusilla CCMP1545]
MNDLDFAEALRPVSICKGAGEVTFDHGKLIHDVDAVPPAVYVVTKGLFHAHDREGKLVTTIKPGEFIGSVSYFFDVFTHHKVTAAPLAEGEDAETKEKPMCYAIPWIGMAAAKTTKELAVIYQQISWWAHTIRMDVGRLQQAQARRAEKVFEINDEVLRVTTDLKCALDERHPGTLAEDLTVEQFAKSLYEVAYIPNAGEHTFEPGQEIIKYNSKPIAVWVVLEGTFEAFNHDKKRVNIFHPGDLLATVSVCYDAYTHNNVIAADVGPEAPPARAYAIPMTALPEIMRMSKILRPLYDLIYKTAAQLRPDAGLLPGRLGRDEWVEHRHLMSPFRQNLDVGLGMRLPGNGDKVLYNSRPLEYEGSRPERDFDTKHPDWAGKGFRKMNIHYVVK